MKCNAITRKKRQCSHKVVHEDEGYCNLHLRRKGKIECAVCTNLIKKDPKLPCNHDVHRNCIIKDAIIQNRQVAQCPICRMELPSIWENNKWRPTIYPINLYNNINDNNTIPIFEDTNILGRYDPSFRTIQISINDVRDMTIQSILDTLGNINIRRQ